MKKFLCALAICLYCYGLDTEVRTTSVGAIGQEKIHKVSYKKGTDIKHGKAFWLDTKGNVLQVTNYNNGKKDGEEIFYNDDSEEIQITFFKQDKLHGEYKEFYDKKILKFSVNYENGLKQGSAKWYHNNKILARQVNFSDDKRNGEELEYYQNGNLSKKCNYENDLLQGECVSYYPNKRINQVINYKQSLKNGISKSYNQKGILLSTSEYENDEKIGIEALFSDDGILQMQRIYKQKCPTCIEVKVYNESGSLKTEMLYENYLAIWQKDYNEQGEMIRNKDCKIEYCISALGL